MNTITNTTNPITRCFVSGFKTHTYTNMRLYTLGRSTHTYIHTHIPVHTHINVHTHNIHQHTYVMQLHFSTDWRIFAVHLDLDEQSS